MKKGLTDIDGALTDQRVKAPSKTPLNKYTDTTFGVHRRQDEQLGVGNKVVWLDANGKTLSVDETRYNLTPGLFVLITNDYQVYKSLVPK